MFFVKLRRMLIALGRGWATIPFLLVVAAGAEFRFGLELDTSWVAAVLGTLNAVMCWPFVQQRLLLPRWRVVVVAIIGGVVLVAVLLWLYPAYPNKSDLQTWLVGYSIAIGLMPLAMIVIDLLVWAWQRRP